MFTSKKLKLDIFCLLLQAHLSPNSPLPVPSHSWWGLALAEQIPFTLWLLVGLANGWQWQELAGRGEMRCCYFFLFDCWWTSTNDHNPCQMSTTFFFSCPCRPVDSARFPALLVPGHGTVPCWFSWFMIYLAQIFVISPFIPFVSIIMLESAICFQMGTWLRQWDTFSIPKELFEWVSEVKYTNRDHSRRNTMRITDN